MSRGLLPPLLGGSASPIHTSPRPTAAAKFPCCPRTAAQKLAGARRQAQRNAAETLSENVYLVLVIYLQCRDNEDLATAVGLGEAGIEVVEPPKSGEGLGSTSGEPEITDLGHATCSRSQQGALPWG